MGNLTIDTIEPVPLPAHCTVDVRIVGCGRPFRRDDQVGLLVADALRRSPPRCTRIEQAQASSLDLLPERDDAKLLIIIDAARGAMGIEVGRVECIRFGAARRPGAPALPLPADLRGADSTHVIGVQTALELGAALGTLPPEVWVYAVFGRDFGYGEELSPGVAAALAALPERIAHDVAAWCDEGRRDA